MIASITTFAGEATPSGEYWDRLQEPISFVANHQTESTFVLYLGVLTMVVLMATASAATGRLGQRRSVVVFDQSRHSLKSDLVWPTKISFKPMKSKAEDGHEGVDLEEALTAPSRTA